MADSAGPGPSGGAPPVIAPMLAVPGPLPVPDDDWAFEAKWDGVRCVLTVTDDGTVRPVSRAGNDLTAAYPELLVPAGGVRGHTLVLDGEVVAPDAAGRPDFGLLQHRMGVTDARRAAHLARETPVRLVLFDVLYLDGRSLLAEPYRERRRVLSGLELSAPAWSVPAALPGHSAEAWDAVVRAGLEGVVAKRLDSPYTPGARSAHWRKTKRVETLDVVIGGWTPGLGGLRGLPGAVLVGTDAPEGLRFAGAVGSGLSLRERRELAGYLEVLARADPPFAGPVGVAGARWVEPRLVAEVTASSWTDAGRLRHPVWQRLRPDLTRLG
ncbi:non-homologous end-joining DNA ligase [Streptomyces sp. NPDC059080]|uniref:non-homologous end-joining DNA ligase n=1 Tax=Streptomyces sp. NPDC059080 TaxID=3346718 RepID=UPI00368D1A1F